MLINPYLIFDGNCKEAFDFYAKTLGGKIVFSITYGETPDAMEMTEHKDRIAHVRLIVGDNVIMGGDAPPGRYQKPQGVTVNIKIDTAEEAERLFKALAEKGQVFCELEETFWAVRFGIAADRFGIPWMVNCEKPLPK